MCSMHLPARMTATGRGLAHDPGDALVANCLLRGPRAFRGSCAGALGGRVPRGGARKAAFRHRDGSHGRAITFLSSTGAISVRSTSRRSINHRGRCAQISTRKPDNGSASGRRGEPNGRTLGSPGLRRRATSWCVGVGLRGWELKCYRLSGAPNSDRLHGVLTSSSNFIAAQPQLSPRSEGLQLPR